MHYRPTKKTMATIKQQTMHPTMQTLQNKTKQQYSQEPINQTTTKRISTASMPDKTGTNA